MMKILSIMALAAVAQAASLTLPYGFEGDAAGLDVKGQLSNGFVIHPSVDIVGPDFHSLDCNTGTRCLDMTGTDAVAGGIHGQFNGMADTLYTVTFWLSGSQRNFSFATLSDTVEAEINGIITSFTLDWDAPWQQFQVQTLADSNGAVRLRFTGVGNDNVGLLLDDIDVAATSQSAETPEPLLAALVGASLIVMARMRYGRPA